MTIFELVAKITADSSGFDKAVNKADKSGKSLHDSLSKTFGKIGKIAVAAFSGAMIKKGIDMMVNLANEVSAVGDKIDKQSQALGLSRRAYQEWDYILSQNGASIDNLGTSMRTINNLILSAAEGSEEAKDTFAELGIGIHELEGLSPEDQFEAIVRAFQKMPPGAQKSALAVKIFGRAGMQLMPLLNSSSDSIDELRENAENLGFIMSDEAVDASVAYSDAMDDLKRTVGGVKNAIVAQFLPKLTEGIKHITAYAGKLKRAYDEKGFAGIWETLVEDFKNIKWPSWDDVRMAAETAWNTVVEGVKGLAKLVFGTKADGSVNWPDWDTVKEKAKEAWEKIKEGALKIADWLGGLVFGRKEDGTVAWPDVGQLAKDFSMWWSSTAVPALQDGMVWVLKLFGMPEENAQQIAETIGAWWSTVVDSATSVLNWALHLPESPYEAGAQLREIIGEWWEGVKSYAEGVLKWVIGLFSIGDSDGAQTRKKISDWWKDKVKPFLKDVLNFTLGLFGLPDAEEMKTKIIKWWDDVKRRVGQLALNATVNPILNWFGQDSIVLPGGENNGESSGGQPQPSGQYDGRPSVGSHGFAKGTSYVPYDMVARLHRGEQVLTASQARHRDGGQVDIPSIMSAMVSAVQEGMSGASVNSYLDGRRVTGSVNRNTLNQLRARRFAMA